MLHNSFHFLQNLSFATYIQMNNSRNYPIHHTVTDLDYLLLLNRPFFMHFYDYWIQEAFPFYVYFMC